VPPEGLFGSWAWSRSAIIIVKNGDVALFGTVSSEADKIKAGMEARSVFGVHNVDNQTQVVKD
jgi:osmotically-inducible protein OsmY